MSKEKAIMLLWAEIKQLKRDVAKVRNYPEIEEEQEIDRTEEELEELLKN